MMAPGPVSEVLLAELKELLRQRAFVVWLDPTATYSAFVDALDGQLAPVARYRGSFARLLRDAAPHALGASPTPLLVHLAGLDEATVVRTPALELAAAGYRWQRELGALVTTAAEGRVPPADIARFVETCSKLEQADTWLTDRLAEAEGGLSAALRAMSLADIVDQLLGKEGLAARIAHPSDLADIWAHLHRQTGLPERWWLPLTPPDGRFSANDVAYALASWALCVEYIHDPVPRVEKAETLAGVRDLPAAVVATCRRLAHTLRANQTEFYRRTADETEIRIAKERDVDANSLGHIDTFRFEENAVLRAALAALDPASDAPSAWEPVLRWAEGRADRSFWLRQDETRKMAWRLVLDAGRLAQAIAAAGARLPRTLDLSGAVAWYASKGARVDQLHRVLEQDCAVLLRSELPEFEALVLAIEGVRAAWWAWAQEIAEDFSALCKREGFLPEPALQQRTLFDEVVVGASASSRDDGVTAYFMVDALRYEMAEALRPTFDGAGTTAVLSARLAELPTITDIGMNALAPVMVGGKLHPVLIEGAFKGFQVNEYRVKDPPTRKRAIQARVGGATCPWMSLEEVTGRDATSLRKAIAQARVVVVHSQELDTAGESGIGLTTFEPILRQLREAWLRLREAGVRRFVITADHGFLLLRGAPALPHGTRTDPSRRHVVSSVVADHAGEVRVPLATLGYAGATDQLMMPASLQVFRTLQSGQTFVHGGNSLQERVIPVLVVTSTIPRGAAVVRYELRVSDRGGVAGMHRVQVTVVPEGELLFSGRREVDVVLRPRDADGVAIEVWLGNEQAEGQLRVVVGEPTELFFRLRGGGAARVGVEVACAGDVDAAPVMAGFFRVEAARAEAAAPAGRGLREWLESIENPDHRQVLAHIYAHGSITEAEVSSMVGGTSKARRFGSALDDLVPQTAPMQVRVDSVDGVKRYVREDG